MRRFACVAVFGCLIASAAVASDNAPALVIPGRPDVPVMMYGRNIAGFVVEGDWGLYRPGAVAPTVIPTYLPRLYLDYAGYGRSYWGAESDDHYYPLTGRKPGYGRREVNDARPGPAPSYSRSWGAESRDTPATSPSDYQMPQMYLSPQVDMQPRRQYPPVDRQPPRRPYRP